jgi:sarcosine oxidase subunit alpha
VDRRLPSHPTRRFERGAPVTIEFDGQPYRAFTSEPLAVALFASGARVLSRSIKYHRPRTFFCLEGHCGACLARVDGLPNVRTCLEPSRDGLVLEGQNAFPGTDLDVLGAVDWLFPKGMDHHTLMTGSKLLNQVMQKVVRQLSGLGKVPSRAAERIPEVRERRVDVAVVGAGPAGLAAATAAAAAGATTLLCDEAPEPGGSLHAHPGFGPAEARRRAAAAAAAGVEVASRAPAIAWFPEDEGGLLGVASESGLWKVKPRTTVYATGAYDVNLLFEDNDRPGVFSGRAVGRLAVRHGVKAGDRVVVAGEGAYGDALAAELVALGVEVTRVAAGDRLARAHGHAWVDAVDIVDERGKKKRVGCDAVAVCATPAPASEAPRQHGARVRLDPEAGGFAVEVDAQGRTGVSGVYACGDVTGYLGPERAAESGTRVGRAAAEEARGAR